MHQHATYHHIADDHSRALLMQYAIRKGMEQARGDFYYGLLADGLDDAGLTLCAREVWSAYHRRVTFDYPQFAEMLFLHAYRTAYRQHLQDVASGRHTDPAVLARSVEVALGLLDTQQEGDGDQTGE